MCGRDNKWQYDGVPDILELFTAAYLKHGLFAGVIYRRSIWRVSWRRYLQQRELVMWNAANSGVMVCGDETAAHSPRIAPLNAREMLLCIALAAYRPSSALLEKGKTQSSSARHWF